MTDPVDATLASFQQLPIENLVLMALITTVTTPILRRLAPGTELEEPIRKAGFFKPLAASQEPQKT